MDTPRRLARRRAALWTLLAAKLTGGWGLGWDIRWHLLIGRDSFWIPPHVLTYVSVAVGTLVTLGVLVVETRAARRGPAPPDTVRLAGLVGTPGFHLSWLGMALTLIAAPFDDLWHRLFGIDVTLWSPPHLLGLAGAQVSTLALVLIALEVWPAGARRTAALLIGCAFLLGTFAIIADPSGRIAFLYGGLRFYTWPVLAGACFALSLVLAARVTAGRAAPVTVVLLVLLLQASMVLVADVGFALSRPVSSIDQVLAEDDGTSPIAVAHEMARRSGTVPGRALTARLLPLLPALALVAADARRRPVLAGLLFGAALFAVTAPVSMRSPALRHAVPGLGITLVGAALTLAAAAIGAAGGARLADRLLALTRSSPGA